MTNSDETFRIVLISGAVLLFPATLYYRFKSQSSRDNLDRRQEGLAILLTLQPIGLACALGIVASMVNPAAMAWSSLPLPNWLRWAAVVLGATGGGLLLWTFHTLVTRGPYRWVRHLFYDSAALCILANSLIAAEDIGKCAYGIFKKGIEFIGKTIGVASGHPTGAQMAASLSNALEKEVRYNAVTPEQYRALGFLGAEDLGNMFQHKRDFEEYYYGARNLESARALTPPDANLPGLARTE
ncbi:MAG: hypothetical protein EXQ58_02190 [Acidobacteria bacterium]|nr:hypothetical protein [Acidobacteriota bacterium]